MPTYEYECTSCGHSFEITQKMTDAPLEKCPKCKKALRKVIGNGAGIIFKGSGFYATDYRKQAYKEKEKQDKPSCNVSSGKDCSSCPKNARGGK